MEIADAVVVVAGGASGLGEACVRVLAARGARIAVLDLPDSRGAGVVEEFGDAAVFLPTDVSDADGVAASVAQVAEVFGRIDVAVNAAGVAPAHRVVGRDGSLFPLDLFRLVVDVNLVGSFDVARRCAYYMARNEPGPDGERGVIVNVASTAAFEGQVGQAAYAASKGGVTAMTLPLARDLAPWGIRVVAVAPGIMDTPMIAAVPEEVRVRLRDVHVFPRRFGRPEEFAALVAHILENRFLNGEVIRFDAGGRLPPR
jgi:3-hydroxyacyl-CoA dehydrogenase / 3-hydroxy-2-methylbutyryl-CoA dehydrogenase